MTEEEPLNQAQPAENASVVSSKKSGGGCMKGCLGCGCISAIILMVLAVGAGVYLWTQGPAVTESISDGFAIFSKSEGSGFDFASLGGGGTSGQEGTPSLEALISSDRSAAGPDGQPTTANQSADRFFEVLDTPMSGRDIQNTKATLESWGQTRTIRRFNDLVERAEDLKDDDSLLAGVRTLRVIVGFGFRVRDMAVEFPQHIDRHGGDDFRMRYTQLTVVHRLSQLTAGSGNESWEQAVADALLEDHDANREEFEAVRATLIAASEQEGFEISELPEEEQRRLAEAFGNQFLFVTSAINRDTLQAWSALSDDERRQVAEQLNAPHNWISRTVSAIHGEEEDHFLYFMMLGF